LGIPIWPVLVDDAVMPGPDDLPESLQSLSGPISSRYE
jgi:hypothetical protein